MTKVHDITGAKASQRSDSADLTIKDIARMAGVSISTVSRVINKSGMVTPAKLKSVEDVLERVTYIPNNSARALVKRRTMSAGLIVPTFGNPIFAPTIDGVEETLARSGYGLLVANSHRDPARELAHARTMIERGVDGIILTGSYHHPDLLPMMAARGVIAVSQDDPLGGVGITSIAMPDAAAMASAIDVLVEQGHRRIGIVTGPTGNTSAIAERVRGARARLVHHGIAERRGDLVETEDYSADAARYATRTLLKAHPDLTAIACTGDILAIGVVSQCRRLGLNIPQDMSIVGCGQTVMAQFADPELSTVKLPFKQLGENAAATLLRLVNSHSEDPPSPPLTHEVVSGATLAPPRARANKFDFYYGSDRIGNE